MSKRQCQVKFQFSKYLLGAKQIGRAAVTAHFRPHWLSLASTSKTMKKWLSGPVTHSHFLFLFFPKASTHIDGMQYVAVSEETCSVYSSLSPINITCTKATHICTTRGGCFLWERPEFTQKKKKQCYC